jgi:hypothetical protein
MKKQTGIWIDTSRAVIVTLHNGQEKTTEIQSNVENRVYHNQEGDKGTFIGSHHANNDNKFKNRHDHELDEFYEKVLDQVKSTDELYVFGPAEAKDELKQKLYDEKPFDISKLKSVETTDKMTPNQIVAQVKEFYEQSK